MSLVPLARIKRVKTQWGAKIVAFHAVGRTHMSYATMSRRLFVAASVGSSLLLTQRSSLAAGRGLYDKAIVIDGLGFPGGSNPSPDGFSEAELRDVRASGVTCLHMTMEPVGTTPPDTAFTHLVRDIAFCERMIKAHGDTFARARSAADIREAKRTGRTALLYGVQDAVAFETRLDRLKDLHVLGLRIVQLTYNRRNLLGDGCLEPADAGLSLTGVQAVEQLNELGMLIDLSHCGRRTAADAIRVSKQPVAFTHTGAAQLQDHPRNRTDAELRAVSEKGGVSGIYFMPFLSEGRQPKAADVIRHLEHMIKVAGEDHVSIGTDGVVSAEIVDDEYKKRFAEQTRERREAGIAAPHETEDGYLFAADLNTPRRLETLADMLSARGHSDARIEKILGANLMRLFEEVWKA